MTDKLINPEELEIKLSFTNYKLLRQEEFDLKGSYIYFVKGPNEIGKSSILYALRAALEIKDDTPKKVTIGESEGINEFKIPGADGRMYTVVYEFTDVNTKFVIFDEEGNKISKITEMRNIFKYNHVDATTFLNWSHSAEGRRKQKEYILQLLPAEDYIKFIDLENNEKSDFDKRTEVNRNLESTKRVLSEFVLTPDETIIKNNLEAAERQLKAKEDEYEIVNKSNEELNNTILSITTLTSDKKYVVTDIEDLSIDIAELQKKLELSKNKLESIDTKLKELNTKYDKLDSEQKDLDSKKEALKQTVAKGRTYVNKSKELTERYNKGVTYETKAVELYEETKTLTEAITEYRKQKEEIITNSQFPVDNLGFDEEGYLTINGLRFDEHQTCESDNILIVAQLMCKMNESPIQILGDASLLDFKKLDKLYDIAKENSKIMFVDEIDRNLDKLVIVGYERHDKLPVVEEKGKKNKSEKSAKKNIPIQSDNMDMPDEELKTDLF